MKQILNTLSNSDFISKCTNYIYNTYVYYMSIIPYGYITCLQLNSLQGDLLVDELSTGELFLADLSTG